MVRLFRRLYRLPPSRALIATYLVIPQLLGVLPIRWTRIHNNGRGANYRQIFRVDVFPRGHPIIVKTFASEAVAKQVFDRQSAAFKTLQNTIPPLHFSKRGRFIAFPFAEGIPMPCALMTEPFDRICEPPVRWLRDLHERPISEQRNYRLTEEIDETLRRDFVKADTWLTGIAQTWRKRAETLAPVPLVQCHGDFNPGNILISSSSFSVIDFDNHTGFGAALLDLAQFLTHIHLYTFRSKFPSGPDCWPCWRNKILGWYGRPELIDDPFLAYAVQSRRIRLLMRACQQKNPNRIDLLTRKLAQISPRDILDT